MNDFDFLKKYLGTAGFFGLPLEKKIGKKSICFLLLQVKCVFDRNEKFVHARDRNFFSASICFFK